MEVGGPVLIDFVLCNTIHLYFVAMPTKIHLCAYTPPSSLPASPQHMTH
jgi:hypothetical protein